VLVCLKFCFRSNADLTSICGRTGLPLLPGSPALSWRIFLWNLSLWPGQLGPCKICTHSWAAPKAVRNSFNKKIIWAKISHPLLRKMVVGCNDVPGVALGHNLSQLLHFFQISTWMVQHHNCTVLKTYWIKSEKKTLFFTSKLWSHLCGGINLYSPKIAQKGLWSPLREQIHHQLNYQHTTWKKNLLDWFGVSVLNSILQASVPKLFYRVKWFNIFFAINLQTTLAMLVQSILWAVAGCWPGTSNSKDKCNYPWIRPSRFCAATRPKS
jgi:hypothetical protein